MGWFWGRRNSNLRLRRLLSSNLNCSHGSGCDRAPSFTHLFRHKDVSETLEKKVQASDQRGSTEYPCKNDKLVIPSVVCVLLGVCNRCYRICAPRRDHAGEAEITARSVLTYSLLNSAALIKSLVAHMIKIWSCSLQRLNGEGYLSGLKLSIWVRSCWGFALEKLDWSCGPSVTYPVT